MKVLVTMLLALGLMAPFAASSFAGDNPTDQLSCEDAGMIWDDGTETCSPAE